MNNMYAGIFGRVFILENCVSILENCVSILENRVSILENCVSILENCVSTGDYAYVYKQKKLHSDRNVQKLHNRWSLTKLDSRTQNRCRFPLDYVQVCVCACECVCERECVSVCVCVCVNIYFVYMLK